MNFFEETKVALLVAIFGALLLLALVKASSFGGIAACGDQGGWPAGTK